MGMEKYAKTIIPTIEANYERYTETERHIADYFLKNDAIRGSVRRIYFHGAFRFACVTVKICQEKRISGLPGICV